MVEGKPLNIYPLNQELRGGGQHPSYQPSYANYYAPQSLNYAQHGGSYAPHQYFPPGAFYAQEYKPIILVDTHNLRGVYWIIMTPPPTPILL